MQEFLTEVGRGFQPDGPPSEFRLRQILRAFEKASKTFHGENRLAILEGIGLTQRLLGKYDLALAYFNQVRASKPDHSPTISNIAAVQIDLGRYADAFENLLKVETSAPNTVLMFAIVFAMMDRPADARSAFEMAVALPVSPELQWDKSFFCAMVAAKIGYPVEACELFARAISAHKKQKMGTARAIDIINATPDEDKRSLQYRDAASLVNAIQTMNERGEQLLEWHAALSALPAASNLDAGYHDRARDVYESMATFRARATSAVMADADAAL